MGVYSIPLRASSPTPHPPAHSFNPQTVDDLGYVYPLEMPAEPDFDSDDDNKYARERNLLLDDLSGVRPRSATFIYDRSL
jgi:hypothetical protein